MQSIFSTDSLADVMLWMIFDVVLHMYLSKRRKHASMCPHSMAREK